jgi:hypothetical protein
MLNHLKFFNPVEDMFFYMSVAVHYLTYALIQRAVSLGNTFIQKRLEFSRATLVAQVMYNA